MSTVKFVLRWPKLFDGRVETPIPQLRGDGPGGTIRGQGFGDGDGNGDGDGDGFGHGWGEMKGGGRGNGNNYGRGQSILDD